MDHESLYWAEKIYSPSIKLNFNNKQLIQIFCSSDLAPYVGNGNKVKIPSEIKPPLDCLENPKKCRGYWMRLHKWCILINPNWHQRGHFSPLVLLGSDFVRWIFIKNIHTFLEVKIDINRVNLTPCKAHWVL